MAWSAPRVWTTGEVLTAANMNAYVSNNLTDLDRRTSPVADYIAASESTNSISFTDLATAGPTVTVTIGSTGKAHVSVYARIDNTVSPNGTGLMGFALSGANTVAADSSFAIQGTLYYTGGAGLRFGSTFLVTGLSAGVTTFKAKYFQGTSGNTATFQDRRLTVTPLGS